MLADDDPRNPPALPFPSREEVLNYARMRDSPQDFLMQDPAQQFEPAILHDGVATTRLARTNREAHKLKKNSFVVWGWCEGGERHQLYSLPCHAPHPIKIMIFRGLRLHEGRMYGKVASVYHFRNKQVVFCGPVHHSEDNYASDPDVERWSVPLGRLLWVRALRNPFVDWSPNRHRDYGKAIRVAVRSVISIWSLEPGNALSALPRELLWAIFTFL